MRFLFLSFISEALIASGRRLASHFTWFFASLWKMMETFLRHDIIMGHLGTFFTFDFKHFLVYRVAQQVLAWVLSCIFLENLKYILCLLFSKCFVSDLLSKCTIWQPLQKCALVIILNEEQLFNFVWRRDFTRQLQDKDIHSKKSLEAPGTVLFTYCLCAIPYKSASLKWSKVHYYLEKENWQKFGSDW